MKKQKPPELNPHFITVYLILFLIYVSSMIFRNISPKWVIETGFFSGLLGEVLLLLFLSSLSFFEIFNFYFLVRFIRGKYPLLLRILAVSEGLFVLLMILLPTMLITPWVIADVLETPPSAPWILFIMQISDHFPSYSADFLNLLESLLRILQAIVIVYLLLDRRRYIRA